MTGHYEYVFECGFECIMELEYDATKGHGATFEHPAEEGMLEITSFRCVAIEGREPGRDEELFRAIAIVFEYYYDANRGEINELIWQRIQEEAEHCE